MARNADDCLGAGSDSRDGVGLAWWPDGSLLGVVFKIYWKKQLQSLCFEFGREGSAVLVAVALRHVVLFMEDPGQPAWYGYLLGACMFAATQGQAFFMWHNVYIRPSLSASLPVCLFLADSGSLTLSLSLSRARARAQAWCRCHPVELSWL